MTSMPTYFPGRGTIVEESYLKGYAEGYAKGLAEEYAKSILQILGQRGVTVSARTREHVTACTDMDVLNRWFDRAITVDNEQDLLAADDAD